MNDTSISTTIRVNGAEEILPSPILLTDWLAARHITPETAGVAVAMNGSVVRRGLWAETTIQPNDKLEIVTARQGG